MNPEIVLLVIAGLFGSGGIGGIIGNKRGTQRAINGLGGDIKEIKVDVKEIKRGMYGPNSLDHRVTFLEAQSNQE